eukprot:scaffold178831_cov21-Tisochrysis_lutea.AAC.1
MGCGEEFVGFWACLHQLLPHRLLMGYSPGISDAYMGQGSAHFLVGRKEKRTVYDFEVANPHLFALQDPVCNMTRLQLLWCVPHRISRCTHLPIATLCFVGAQSCHEWLAPHQTPPRTFRLLLLVFFVTAATYIVSCVCAHHAAWQPDIDQRELATLLTDASTLEIRLMSKLGLMDKSHTPWESDKHDIAWQVRVATLPLRK